MGEREGSQECILQYPGPYSEWMTGIDDRILQDPPRASTPIPESRRDSQGPSDLSSSWGSSAVPSTCSYDASGSSSEESGSSASAAEGALFANDFEQSSSETSSSFPEDLDDDYDRRFIVNGTACAICRERQLFRLQRQRIIRALELPDTSAELNLSSGVFGSSDQSSEYSQ